VILIAASVVYGLLLLQNLAKGKALRTKDQLRQGVIELLQAFRPIYDNDPID